MRERFWERFSLGELNRKEWEALCDGCGQCCLMRERDNDEVTVYGVACPLLDMDTVRCSDYENRQQKMPHCHELSASNVPRYHWLPETCAYRRLHFGKPLPSWHPLLVGSRDRMRHKGIKVNRYSLPASAVPRRHMRRHVIARIPIRVE